MITTIHVKDIIQYLVKYMILILVAVCSTRFFLMNSHVKNSSFLNIDCKKIIKANIPITYLGQDNKLEDKPKTKITSRSRVARILNTELPNIVEKKVEENDIKENEKAENTEEERTTSQIKETYTTSYGSVKIKNLTKIQLTEEMIKPDYMIKNKKDVIIFHTHTCESYTPTKKNNYEASGKFRTTNLDYSVVKVGRELKKELEKLKFHVIQNETKHDYPAYTGSYTRSLATVEEMLKKNKNTEIVFDIHRDAVGSKSDYAPTTEINGEKVAQLMFVIGTNDGGGKHPNWKNNLKFAVKVQEKANEMYPGLFRSINLRSATFNQKVTNAASIIEVGATGNTLEEATASMKYLAKVLDAVLNEK